MTTIYVVSSSNGIETVAYTTREEAEKAAKNVMWHMEMSGGRGMAYVKEIQIAEKFEEK